MPAALSRPCRTCGVSCTPAEFRDPGEHVGRPPASCYSCRTRDARLAARHARNVDARPAARDQQRAYAARPERVALAAMRRTHPAGIKTCPSVAGCGRDLPLSAFGRDRHQADSLSPLCAECTQDARQIQALRSAA